MPSKVWTVVGPEWDRAINALRVIDDQIPRWLEEQMEDEIVLAENRARATVSVMEVRGGPAGHTGMRARVASGVGHRKGIDSKNKAYFRIYTSMAERDEVIIPRGLDRVAGWRHPLFGDKKHWYNEGPVRPGWFTDTIADSRDEISRALQRALERAAQFVDNVS
jgi:hypothetical protein